MPLGAAVQPSASRPEPCRNHGENQTDHAAPVDRETRRRRRRRRDDWIRTSSGNIHYRADNVVDRPTNDPVARFPTPLIGPRRTRPHSIRIVGYPSGYVPRELRVRPRPPSRRAQSRAAAAATTTATTTATRRRTRLAALARSSRSDLPIRLALTRLFQSFSGSSLSNIDIPHPSNTVPAAIQALPDIDRRRRRSESVPARRSNPHRPQAATSRSRREHQHPRTKDHNPNPDHRHNRGDRARERERNATEREGNGQRDGNSAGRRSSSRHQQHHRRPSRPGYYPPNAMAAIRGAAMPPSSYQLGSHRNSLAALRSAKPAVNTIVTEMPKPVATGSGVACSILLAEPNVFLSGFDHDGQHRDGRGGTALLRGKLQLTVSKNVKIKAVQLKLAGRARTDWPEGIPPLKQDLFEEESLRTQVLTFFNVLNDGWGSEYGNQCTYKLKTTSANSSSTHLAVPPSGQPPPPSSYPQRNNLTAKELKRLSLQNAQSRSFGKGDDGIVNPAQAKGFKVFYPGTYDYSFELPIDHHQLETTKLQYGSVKWELHATVDRAGAFKPNLHGVKEVPIIRLPDQMSLEMSEPISISRQWEDQLHYDIMVSGKSFPIGAKIPIAFKLTPLAKVHVHKLKVFITESVEYWTNDRRVTRKDPGRKILLLEKSAGKELDPSWSSSELTTIRGGELTAQQRRDAREAASRRRASEASRRKRDPDPLPPPTENLLGDLDLGLETMWGSTEIEANVQIPTCEMMARNKDLRLHPDCSWKNINVYHWIKVVLRISRLNPDDPSGTKRRHFEISIDSPLTILNCRATQANTYLPAYSGSIPRSAPYQPACGCPDSATIAMETSPSSSTGTLPDPDGIADSTMPAQPQAAHLSHTAMSPVVTGGQNPNPSWSVDGGGSRPIHLLRAPSFSPPAFEDDTAPPVLLDEVADIPPIMTPPPQYDHIIGTPSVDGLADYFARLAEYGFENEEDSSSDGDDMPPRILDRSGRVNVANPRTPGGRRMPSRSVEIPRTPVDLNISALLHRTAQARAAGEPAESLD